MQEVALPQLRVEVEGVEEGEVRRRGRRGGRVLGGDLGNELVVPTSTKAARGAERCSAPGAAWQVRFVPSGSPQTRLRRDWGPSRAVGPPARRCHVARLV